MFSVFKRECVREFQNAYPVKWSGPDLTGGHNGMTIESIELTDDRFSKLSGMPK